jgi:hypothetical protein
MKCENCGRQIQNEEANFCEYCGSSFREQRQGSFHMPPRNQELPNMNGPMNNTPPMQGFNMPGAPFAPQPMERPTSFFSWLGTYGLLFIPIAGWLAFIILLFIWSFSDSTPVSKKNWARATLIFAGILIVAFVVYMIFIMSTPMYQQMYQQMMDSYTNGVQ